MAGHNSADELPEMANSSDGNTPGNLVAEAIQHFKDDSASGISPYKRSNAEWPAHYPAPGPTPVPDAALAELSEMATADLANLSNFLNPVSRGVAQPPKLSVPNAALPGPHVSQSSVSRIANEPTKARVGSNLQQIATAGIYRLWVRAPLLVISLAYSAVGLVGAGVFAAGNLVVSASAFAVFGEVLLGLWACGFLSMVGFGMYCRVKYMPPLRN